MKTEDIQRERVALYATLPEEHSDICIAFADIDVNSGLVIQLWLRDNVLVRVTEIITKIPKDLPIRTKPIYNLGGPYNWKHTSPLECIGDIRKMLGSKLEYSWNWDELKDK